MQRHHCAGFLLILLLPVAGPAVSPAQEQGSWSGRSVSFSSFASGSAEPTAALAETVSPATTQVLHEADAIRQTVYRPVDLSSPATGVTPVSAGSADLLLSGSVRTAAFDTAESEMKSASHADLLPVPSESPAASSSVPFFQLSPGDSSDSDSAATGGDANATGTETLMRGAAWLIVLMCLACLAILGLRRWQRQHGLLPTTDGRSRVLDTLSLGPGRTVSLIEMNGLRALVGSDAGGIRTIVLAPSTFEEEVRLAADADSLQPPVH